MGTDESLRNQDDRYHLRFLSQFLYIEGLDMMFDWPIDPFHLVYLGVIQRLLSISFFNKLDFKKKLPKVTRNRINKRMLSNFVKFYPAEFHKKRLTVNKLSFLESSGIQAVSSTHRSNCFQDLLK